MTISRTPVAFFAVLIGWLLFGFAGHAADLTAAWATNATSCKGVFVKNGNRIAFAKDSDLHGSGLIIEENRIRGKMASCSISSRKAEGAIIHYILICAGDALITNIQLSLKIDDDNKITRIFPGTPELNVSYYRCSF